MNLYSTERLDVRRLTIADAEAMHAIYGDAETMRYVGDSNPLLLEHCTYWIEVTDRNFERRGYGMMAVIERATGEMIGCAGVVHPNQQEDPEVKYAFRRDKWGLGFATEVMTAMIRFARTSLGRTYLVATIHPDHVKSQAVMRKAGFLLKQLRTNEDGSTTQIWRIEL